MKKAIADILVSEFTSPNSISVSKGASLSSIRELMRENGIRHIPVIESQSPVGVISDRDIKNFSHFSDQREFLAEDIMSPEPFVVSSETPLEEVAMAMSEKKIGSALVHDASDNSYGIFTSTDALNALIEILRGENLS